MWVGGSPTPWIESGFTPTGDALVIGTIALRCLGADAPPGLPGWSFDAPVGESIDGIATATAPAATEAPVHPNGIVAVDHVVAMSSDLDATMAAFVDAGFEIRRTRDAVLGGGARMRQAFIRAGDAILELVGPVEPGERTPSRLWGLALVANDLDATVERFAGRCSAPKPAVQPGRRIATLDHRALGLGVRVALMSPHTAAPGAVGA